MRCCTAQMVKDAKFVQLTCSQSFKSIPCQGSWLKRASQETKPVKSAPLQHAWQLLVCVAVIHHSNESPTLSTNPPTEPVYWRTHQPVLDRCAWNSLKVIEFVMAVPRRQIKAICMHTAAESHSGNQADEACIQRDAYSLKRFIVPLRHTHGRHRS